MDHKVTEEFLEKHRNNAKKYMSQLNLSRESSRSSSSDHSKTLERIKSKFGVDLTRKAKVDPPALEPSIHDFIDQIRKKYLAETPSEKAVLTTEDLIDLEPIPPKSEVSLDLLSFDLEAKTDSPLRAEDLLDVNETKPKQKPPRTKLETFTTETDVFNKSLSDSTLSLRKAHTETIINNTISDIIANKLGLFQKKALPTFDSFLTQAPIRKTPNRKKILDEDSELAELMKREKDILNELESLRKEAKKIQAVI